MLKVNSDLHALQFDLQGVYIYTSICMIHKRQKKKKKFRVLGPQYTRMNVACKILAPRHLVAVVHKLTTTVFTLQHLDWKVWLSLCC